MGCGHPGLRDTHSSSSCRRRFYCTKSSPWNRRVAYLVGERLSVWLFVRGRCWLGALANHGGVCMNTTRPPNPRLQRTRFALLRSPLSRKPLGVTKLSLGVIAISAFGFLGASSPPLKTGSRFRV